jgi:O-antigen/teichoic acid export membrane protein
LTQTDNPPSQTPATATPIPLSDQAARGFLYTFGQVVLGKVVNIIGILVLSRLLDDADYGYVGLAYAVYAFAALVQQGGMMELLIQRGREYEIWANAAFWMALAMGLVSTALLVTAAPAAAWFFGDQRLTPLIMILAGQLIMAALSTVPEAGLRIQMRFKLLSLIGLLTTTAVTVLSIVFAWLGFGAYSFIIPGPIVLGVRAAALWRLSPPPVRRQVEFHRWPHMLGANAMLFAASVFQTIAWQGDYVILGRLYPHDKPMVGRYYWAYNLSTQTAQLLSLNIAGVLLPSLTRLQEELARLRHAFLRSTRVLSAIGAPACLLQAALAEPVVRLAFDPKWHAAIPIIQVLSAGFVFTTVFPACGSLLKAQGRFTMLLLQSVAAAALFVGCVYVGARQAAGVGAAWGVAAHAVLLGPAALYATIRPLGGTGSNVAGVFGVPIAAGAVAVGGAMLIADQLPVALPARDLARVAVITLVSIPAYVLMLRAAAPAVWNELLERIRGLIGR